MCYVLFMTLRHIVVLFLVFLSTGCYTEWDIPVTPRKDPCTGLTQKGNVYVNPTCRNVEPLKHLSDQYPKR